MIYVTRNPEVYRAYLPNCCRYQDVVALVDRFIEWALYIHDVEEFTIVDFPFKQDHPWTNPGNEAWFTCLFNPLQKEVDEDAEYKAESVASTLTFQIEQLSHDLRDGMRQAISVRSGVPRVPDCRDDEAMPWPGEE